MVVILILTLLLLIALDFLVSIFRLRLSGIKAGYKLLSQDIGYISRNGCSFKKSTGLSKEVLIVGDSTAVGSGANPDKTIGGRLAEKYNVNVTNLGVSGAKTKDIINQIKSVSDRKFFLIILHAGNNDVVRLTNLKELESDVALLFDAAKSIGEKVVVFRGGNFGSIPLFPYVLRFYFGKRAREVGSIFKRIADEKGVYYVEKFMRSRDDIFLKNPHHFYCWDLLHLNDNGYAVWFDFLIQKMEEFDIELPVITKI
jgi:lysophospholipase L1-like esterase